MASQKAFRILKVLNLFVHKSLWEIIIFTLMLFRNNFENVISTRYIHTYVYIHVFCTISPSAAPLIMTSLPLCFFFFSAPSYSPFNLTQAVCFKVYLLCWRLKRSCWINGTSLNSITRGMTSTEESSVFQRNFCRGFNTWMTRNLFNTIYNNYCMWVAEDLGYSVGSTDA